MLKLNVNGQSFVVEGYTRSPMAQVNFHSCLVMEETSPSLKFLSGLLNINQTQKLAIHIGMESCTYECEMTSFDPIYETQHEPESIRIAKSYDFRVGLCNHVVCSEYIDIELHPVRRGFFTGVLKGKVWFILDGQDINALNPPWPVALEYYDRTSEQWVKLLEGWDLTPSSTRKSQPIVFDGHLKGAQIVTPLTAILL